jgi:hypothetical protein
MLLAPASVMTLLLPKIIVTNNGHLIHIRDAICNEIEKKIVSNTDFRITELLHAPCTNAIQHFQDR